MITGTLLMMLVVGLIVSFAILGMFIWGAKTGQFDDTQKMMDGLLFDSPEDLNDAISRENKKDSLEKEQNKSKPKN
jgi:cbb3-type cytochrome oxidase maturation protein